MRPLPHVCLVVVVLLSTSVAAQDKRPNLVLVLNDDVSAVEYDFLSIPKSRTRNGAETPTLNMMVEKGVSFMTAWAMPICGPTRGSLVTGLYGQITGWRSNQKPPGSLGSKFGTFGTLAQENGYKVLIAGKWQMEGEVKSYGYDEACLWEAEDSATRSLSSFKDEYVGRGGVISPGDKPQSNQGSRFWFPFIVKNGELINTTADDFGPDVIFDCAMDFMTRQARLGNKFLVYLPTFIAHADYDYDIDDGNFNHYLPVPSRDSRGRFLGREAGPGTIKRQVEYQDYLMKKLLEHVASLGLEKETVTFFAGDNGTLGYGKKRKESERSTRVPFVVYGPGTVVARQSSMELVSTNDIYATFASLMKASIPRGIPRPHSVDISGYLTGMTEKIPRKWLYGLLENDHWIRTRARIYDGNKDLWRCENADERSCTKIPRVAYSANDTARVERFEKVICMLEKKMALDNNRVFQSGTCN